MEYIYLNTTERGCIISQYSLTSKQTNPLKYPVLIKTIFIQSSYPPLTSPTSQKTQPDYIIIQKNPPYLPKMTKQSNENILLPAKFISLALHLLVVTMAYFSYNDNIIIAYPSLTSKTDLLYIGARTSFLACNSMALIFLAFQIVVLFIGTNMFRHRVNFFNATLHFLGAILWSSYIFQQWQFDQLWAVWFVCSFIPFALEIFTLVSVVNK